VSMVTNCRAVGEVFCVNGDKLQNCTRRMECSYQLNAYQQICRILCHEVSGKKLGEGSQYSN
jgi:homoserine acetyltransferase